MTVVLEVGSETEVTVVLEAKSTVERLPGAEVVVTTPV